MIPVAGSSAELEDLLVRSKRIELGPGDTLVVVDNRPPGGEAHPVEPLPGTIAARGRRSSYYARNRGAAAGDAEWLVFIDADVDPPPDLLDRYFAADPQEDTGVLVGAVEDALAPGEEESPVARFLFERASMSQANTMQGRWAYAQTANCAVRRRAFEAVGGFREDVRSGGDADLCFRLRRAGWTLELRADARVTHRTRASLGSMARQRARHGSGSAWLEREYPGSSPPSPLLGLAWWTAKRLSVAAGQWLRGARDQAAQTALDPISSWAFELGRQLPNHVRLERPAGGLRLAAITDVFPVLSETFVFNEVEELTRQGHEVLVEATGRPPEAEDPRARAVSYLEDDPLAAKLAAFAELALRHPWGVLRDCVSRSRWRAEEPVRPLRALALRARRLRLAGVIHLHVHFAANAALDAMRLAAIEGLPYSVTAHAYDIFESPANLREKLERAAFATTGCEYNRRYLEPLASPAAAKRIHVMVMGVDPGAFRRSTDYPGGRHVVAVGRLVEKKGFSHLIEAIGKLEQERPVERLSIVGEGPLRADLRSQIDRLGLKHRAHLLGGRVPQEVRRILESADLLAMPSVIASDGDRDSMPVVVKEAMAMEVPVVASDEVGLSELVEPAFGRLVPPADPIALAGAIGGLLDLPPAERAAMGLAGRQRILQCCDLRRETARLAEWITAAVP